MILYEFRCFCYQKKNCKLYATSHRTEYEWTYTHTRAHVYVGVMGNVENQFMFTKVKRANRNVENSLKSISKKMKQWLYIHTVNEKIVLIARYKLFFVLSGV